MQIALTGAPRAWPEELKSLGNWILCWVLLPNLGYWLLWIIGGPPRGIPILVAGLAGILTHRSSFRVKFAAFVAVWVYSALNFVGALFNLGILSLLQSLRFAAELSPAASIEYLFCALGALATLAAAWVMLHRSTELPDLRKILIASALTLTAASADASLAEGRRGSYKRLPDPGAPFTSAVTRSGLAELATGERHVLLVMVEAMGQPANARLRAQLVNLWARPEVRARYEVTAGETLFYGSTTNGEVRELCGRWGEYEPLLERADPGCLPSRLGSLGYRTRGWHSFSGTFFERLDWYPNIGFAEMRFAPELIGGGATPCPGVFAGACDRDVPRQIGEVLKSADSPQFLYWLTVNSHLPVVESSSLGTDRCEGFDPGLARDFPMTCRMFQLFDQVGEALADEIADQAFPDTEILIVGDHIPPFFDRRHREQFEPDRVPWILLRPKA